jgi:hypothetical protein
VQAQRNIQLQLETHNQYINQLLASRSSELLRSVSAASSARANGGGRPGGGSGRAGGAGSDSGGAGGDGGGDSGGVAGPPLGSPRPASANALPISGLPPQQRVSPVPPPAMLQHPPRGSGTQASAWIGQAALAGLDAGERTQPLCAHQLKIPAPRCLGPLILTRTRT